MLRHRRVTVLVIPDTGSPTYECKVSRGAMLTALAAALGVVVLLFMGLWFYVQYRANSRQVTRLRREKGLLEEEVERIDDVELMLLRLQRSNQQLRTVLGESLRDEEQPQGVRGQRGYESVVEPGDRLRWGHLRTFPGMWPVRGIVIRPFAIRTGGVIIGVAANSIVRAAGAGQVSRVGYDEELGNVVVVDHGGGLTSVYGYARQLLVQDGEYVEKGQPLALSGGKEQSSSLFYAVRLDGRPVDPEKLRLWL